MPVDLNDAEIQAAISSAVEEQLEGLKGKNKDLLNKLAKAKKGSEINPEDMVELESTVEKLTGELRIAHKQAKEFQKQAETMAEKYKEESGFTHKLLVDNGLTSELVKAGVNNPVHLKAVSALLRDQVQVHADDNGRVAKVGDKNLTDFVKEWAGSDEGKHFVSAPVNSGGGAYGGSKSPPNKTMTRQEFDAKASSGENLVGFFKDGGTITD